MTAAHLIRVVKQRVQPGSGDLPYIYTLDKAGALLVSQHLGIDYALIDWKPKPLEENYLFLQHLLETHNLYIAVTLACAKQGIELVAWTYETALRSKDRIDYVELKDTAGAAERVAVIPDSFCVLGTPRGFGHFPIEIDRGTVTLARWRQKIQAYIQYHANSDYQRRYNARNFRLLTVTSSHNRLRHLKEATEAVAPGDERFWFTTFEQVATRTPTITQAAGTPSPKKRYQVVYNDEILTMPVWCRTGSDQFHSLLE